MLILVVGGSPGIVAAGAVDQDVAGTQVLQNSLMHFFQHLGLQHVGLVAFHAVAFSLDLVGQLLDSLFVQVQSSDLGAGIGESTGHSAADQTASAGNDDNFAGVIHIQGKISHLKLPPKY